MLTEILIRCVLVLVLFGGVLPMLFNTAAGWGGGFDVEPRDFHPGRGCAAGDSVAAVRVWEQSGSSTRLHKSTSGLW